MKIAKNLKHNSLQHEKSEKYSLNYVMEAPQIPAVYAIYSHDTEQTENEMATKDQST